METHQLTEREVKALQIAAKSKLKRKGNVWLVPSQAGQGEYQVNVHPDFFNCTCRDHEFTGSRCKHIYKKLLNSSPYYCGTKFCLTQGRMDLLSELPGEQNTNY
jgi:hypothetical protein